MIELGSLAAALNSHRAGQLEQARLLYEEFLGKHPQNFDALQLLGTLYAQLGDYRAALNLFEAALKINRNDAVVQKNYGQALAKNGRMFEALKAFDLAIGLQPAYAEAYFNRGNVCRSLQVPQEALRNFDDAIRLDSRYVDALTNRGAVLQELGRFEEAEASLSAAACIRPNNPEVQFNHGNLLVELKRWDDALRAYERALSLRSEYVEAHYNRAVALLLLGNYREGWADYEWRLRRADIVDPGRDLSGTAWRGQLALRGARLMLYSEQGIGDTIQHLRYVPVLVDQGAAVSLALPPKLWPLVDMLPQPVPVIRPGDAPQIDFHCPLMSLPYSLGTTLSSIPKAVPYLRADEEKVRGWRHALGAAACPRVGLVWSGSAQNDNDARRSIPLQTLQSLFELPIEWHSLQVEYRSGDLETLSRSRLHQHEQADLADTAALVACMDLVISVDTSIAHLSGALGQSVYILLPWMPDYRWLLDRDDSPWYPTATLFRQPRRGDWDAVIRMIKRALRERFSLTIPSSV